MKSIMYHYVRESSAEFPFSAHKEKRDFVSELSLIRSMGYAFYNPSDVMSSCSNSNRKNWDQKGILLTFDDGLKDHISAAYLLKECGISRACFYIPISPYIDGNVLAVHKAQFIRSKFGGKSLMLLEDACRTLGLHLADHESYERERGAFGLRYASHVDDEATKEFKRLINYYGDLQMRDVILDEIIRASGMTIKFEDVYLSEAEIVDIMRMGFEIGSHGCSHTPLSRLSVDQQRHELMVSKRYLEKLTGEVVNSFCYPYGGKSSYNTTTIDLLEYLGYSSAITVESRDITADDLESNPFEIPRYDCNMIDSLFSTAA